MAVEALTNVTTYVAGYDFTGDTNQAAIAMDVVELDKTNFASGGWREVIGGLKSVAFNESGFWQSAADQAVDPQAFPNLGTADRVFTVATKGDETSPAYMFKAMKTQYVLGGTHGEIIPFQLAASGSNGHGVVRGQLAKAKGNVSATGALGSGLNLGAVSSTQYLYATFHVFSAGTTITVQVQSDDANTFLSPTTVATLGPLTATGGTWMTRVAGPITDTWFRFNVSAITGTFQVAGAIAVGS